MITPGDTGPATAQPQVALLRIPAPGGAAATYATIRVSEAADLLTGLAHDATPAQVLPWAALPGLEAHAVSELRHQPARTVVLIGTAVGGTWATWHAPVPAPPPPAAQE